MFWLQSMNQAFLRIYFFEFQPNFKGIIVPSVLRPNNMFTIHRKRRLKKIRVFCKIEIYKKKMGWGLYICADILWLYIYCSQRIYDYDDYRLIGGHKLKQKVKFHIMYVWHGLFTTATLDIVSVENDTLMQTDWTHERKLIVREPESTTSHTLATTREHFEELV